MQVMERPGVRRETNGPVTTIILDRPERRNAVDPPTAEALRAAFRAFDQDRTARVAVLWAPVGRSARATISRPLPRPRGDSLARTARGRWARRACGSGKPGSAPRP